MTFFKLGKNSFFLSRSSATTVRSFPSSLLDGWRVEDLNVKREFLFRQTIPILVWIFYFPIIVQIIHLHIGRRKFYEMIRRNFNVPKTSQSANSGNRG
jgi:hypothetical protein